VQQRESYQRIIAGLTSRLHSGRVLQSGPSGSNKQKFGKRTLSELIGSLPASIPSFGKQPDSSSSFARSFPSVPERVLDAPGLLDDFYLNVLDWGKRNVLAVALGPSVYLWNGKSGTVSELLSLPGEQDYVSSLRWIHDGTALAVGGSNGHVQIWDAEHAKKVRTIVASPGGQRLAAVAWNRHLLSTGSRDGAIATHDVRQARPLILSHESHHATTQSEVCGLEWSPDGTQLASGGNDNVVQVWDWVSGQSAAPRHVLGEHRAAVKALAWCPWRSGLLATGGGSSDRTIRTWNTASGSLVSATPTDAPLSALIWSKTSRELLSMHGSPSNGIRLWRASSTSQSACHLTRVTGLEQAHTGRILHAALSPDARTLVTASPSDESIKFWRAFKDSEDLHTSLSTGKKKPGQSGGGSDGSGDYVLMPKFSRSAAVGRALSSGNRLVL